jgi:hypothetical protein
MKNYLLCVYANRFTFAGLILIVASYVIALCMQESIYRGYILYPMFIGIMLLVFTRFALDTYSTYERVMDSRDAKQAEHFRPISWDYCNMVGYRLALKKLKNKKTA